MKKLIVLLFICITQACSADTTLVQTIKSGVNNVKAEADTLLANADTSTVSKQIYSDVKSAINSIAAGLKVGAEHVYTVLVKQSIVEAITYMVVLLFGIFVICNWFKAYKSDEDWLAKNDDPAVLGIVRIIQLLFSIILIITGVVNIDTIVTGLINPEFGAISRILEIIK